MRRVFLFLALVFCSAPALADSPRGGARPAWSAISAQTVGAGGSVLHFQVGYPGLMATYLGGHSERIDIGARFAFLYGSEAATYTAPGVRLQGVFRFLLGQRGRLRVGLELEPGIFSYFTPYYYPYAERSSGGSFGIALPIKLTFAIPVSPQVVVHAGIDFPFQMTFVRSFEADFPFLFGGGVEFFVIPTVSLGLRLRLGPSVYVVQDFSGVRLGVDALFGVAVRL